MKPVRIQLSRRKGFNLQAASMKLNRLPAVKVDRTTRYGNPFVVGEIPPEPFARYCKTVRVETAAQAVDLFRQATVAALKVHDSSIECLLELRGKNLACWCAGGASCHADVLLELSNISISCEAVDAK